MAGLSNGGGRMTDGTEVSGQRSAVGGQPSVIGQRTEDGGRRTGGQGREASDWRTASNSQLPTPNSQPRTTLRVSLLTGGGDKPYALGLAEALTAEGVALDFIGSDDHAVPELLSNDRVALRNLRGDQRPGVGRMEKTFRVLRYYVRLIRYAATAEPGVFHILWNNRFQLFDRTLLMLYYTALGKRIVFTAHNVNAGRRDGNDSLSNRLSLAAQYALSDHIFVHTERMKTELMEGFKISRSKVTVIPFGINNTVPNTSLTPADARTQLGIAEEDKTLLFFGNIAPYKGLHCLVAAFIDLAPEDSRYRLIIAGRPKGSEQHWREIEQAISRSGVADRIIQKIEYVPDEETELYFKAADVLILPYTQIFQSGVLFLGYAFGLPVIAADVGSLRDEIINGQTGFVFKPGDSSDLAATVRRYFESPLFRDLDRHRPLIRKFANERYSWSTVAARTRKVYLQLLET
jgi:glycosyltransferase involved in cell wall biosynthesis